MTLSAAPGHPVLFLVIYVLGLVVIGIFGKKLSKENVKFISGFLFFIAAILGMSTTSTPLVDLVGSNTDIVLSAILAASWGWMLQVASPH